MDTANSVYQKGNLRKTSQPVPMEGKDHDGISGEVEREYYCSFVDRPMGMSKHVWARIWLGTAHFFGAYGVFKMYTLQYPVTMIPFFIFYGYFAGAGITMGAHRYWTHKSFKANLPLRILLAWMQTTAAQHGIFKWCRDHRIHHKYVDTESDPHNSRLGFWHAHIGWLLKPDPPGFKDKEKTIDLSDLDNDPIVRFQAKYYWTVLVPITVFIIPMSFTHYFWPEFSLLELFCANYVWYLHALHFTFLVNSAAHMWGYRPYEKGIHPRENKLVSYLAVGEGWHNYHHTFPWDYKAAEIGIYKHNWSAMFLDFFAYIGWAYDLKTVPENVVRDRVNRTGDGSHITYGHGKKTDSTNSEKNDAKSEKVVHVWGWGDKDMTEEHYKLAETIRPGIRAG